jgi:hypothetical protein
MRGGKKEKKEEKLLSRGEISGKMGLKEAKVEKNSLLLLEKNPRGLYGELVKGFL